MKTIINYIKEKGKFTFDKLEFNEVDNLIFSAISYVPFDITLFKDNKSYLLGELANIYFKKNDKKTISNNILAIRQGIKVFEKIKDTERYKNLKVYNYEYIGNDEMQFGAICIDIDKFTTYISFEGTDQLISGWKEDFQMSYNFPVPSQKKAIDYLNKSAKYVKKKIILGGHSKGGNLALVSAMYSNFLIKNKIIKIYNNDGPGLRKKEFNSLKYKSIKHKLINIIPNYSFVGLMLKQDTNYKVIDSTSNGLLSHDLCTWKVDDNSFLPTELSIISRELETGMTIWLDKYNDKEREMFVEALFDVCERAGIDDLLDIKNDIFSSTLKLIRETKNIDDRTKEIVLDFFRFLLKFYSISIKKIIQENSPF